MAEIKYFWEDMAVGQVRDLGSLTPTRDEIIAFATQFDPQPFHLDDEAAKASVFGSSRCTRTTPCACKARCSRPNP
jgi:acyl dehydratase